jgi:hypothetical protein
MVVLESILKIPETVKSDQTKMRNAHPPLVPPQWGNEFNNSPPWTKV